MTGKERTNETMIKDLIKDLNPLGLAILRERIVKIAEITKEAVEANPEKWDNPIVDHSYYIYVCDKIFEHCGFEHNHQTKK